MQVLQGAVDYAGKADPSANTKVIGTYGATELSKGGGSVKQAIDSRKSSFVRTQVVNRYGGVIGVSNPVWLLHHAPPGGIPAPRSA